MKITPEYIYKAKNQIIMVLFVPLFCMAFIFLYQPGDFNDIDERFYFGRDITKDTAWHIVITLMVIIGMITSAISRLMMNLYTRKHQLSIVGYIVWVAGEIVAMSLIYTAVACLTSEKPFFEIYEATFLKTVRTLTIPYVICYVYFIWKEKARQYHNMKRMLEEDDVAQKKAYIQIFDEKEKMQLSVRRENLLFMEAAENYVNVWYINNNTPKKMMIRSTMKKIQLQMEGTNVLRCHRSYMINLDHVKVLRREKEGIFLEMGIETVPDIPLSKTYSESITRWLMSTQHEDFAS